VIDGTDTPLSEWSPLVTIGGAYVDFEGFEIRSSEGGCLLISGDHDLVRGNEVHDCYNNGVVVCRGDMCSETVFGVRFDGNVLYEASQKNHDGLSPAWDGGLSTNNAQGTEITNNLVYHNHGEGICVLLARDTLVRGNTVYDNFSVNIYNDNSAGTIIERNFSYCTAESGYERDGSRAGGIILTSEDRATGMPSEGVTVVNNIVLGCRVGFLFSYWGTTSPPVMRDVLVANNTFVRLEGGSWPVGIQIGPEITTQPGSAVVDNIVYQDNGEPTFEGAPAELMLERNAWFGTTPAEAAGPGDIGDDPLLANVGGLAPEDYRITVGSPCVDAASTLAAVAVDFFGTSRPQPEGGAPDIGAHEHTTPADGDADADADADADVDADGDADADSGADASTSDGDAEDDGGARGGCSCGAAPHAALAPGSAAVLLAGWLLRVLGSRPSRRPR
jgi:parallel beta-helix repeat protein